MLKFTPEQWIYLYNNYVKKYFNEDYYITYIL
jgi:hypothetical protein